MSIKELALRRFEADGRAFLDAAGRDPAAPVAACPGWTVDKLVGHVGRVHTWAAQVVRSRSRHPISSRVFPEGPDDPALRLTWAEERWADLLDALRGLDEDEPIWVFIPNGLGAGRFWLRRQAEELALHRWDAQRATGEPDPLDPELAAEGLDELLALYLPNLPKAAAAVSTGASMHVHCTDRDGEWLVRFTPDGAVTTAEHAKGDVAVRGAASDLYLLLWNRTGRDAVEVLGDASVLDRWAEHVGI